MVTVPFREWILSINHVTDVTDVTDRSNSLTAVVSSLPHIFYTSSSAQHIIRVMAWLWHAL